MSRNLGAWIEDVYAVLFLLIVCFSTAVLSRRSKEIECGVYRVSILAVVKTGFGNALCISAGGISASLRDFARPLVIRAGRSYYIKRGCLGPFGIERTSCPL